MNVGDFRDHVPFESNFDAFNMETFDCGSPEEYADLECFTKKMAEVRLGDIWSGQADEQAWNKAPDPAELPPNPFTVLSFADNTNSEECVLTSSGSSNSFWNPGADYETSDSHTGASSSFHVSESIARPILPPTPSLSIAKTLIEVEQELMQQCASTSFPFPVNAPIIVAPTRPTTQIYDAAPCLSLPAECQPFVPFWYDYLIGRIQFLPQEVPAVPQFIITRYRQDAHMLLSWLCSVGNVIRPIAPVKMQVTENEDVEQAMDRKTTAFASRTRNMPSGKTIEDLAFDQFAGFMSYKERQWLIRIQMMQCQGTGDPSIDDYYYVNWKKKQLQKMGLQFDELLMSGSGDCYPMQRRPRLGEYKKYQKTSNNLGRPYQCTSKFPRHLITVEDNEETTSRDVHRFTN